MRAIGRVCADRDAAQRGSELRPERRQRGTGMRLGRDRQSRHRRHRGRHQRHSNGRRGDGLRLERQCRRHLGDGLRPHESVAVGDTATAGSASVNFSTAIGSNTSANFDASTAIGFGAQTTAANQMMFGTGTSIYTLAGVNSAASHAAQKAPLMMLTVDAAGNVSTARIPTCRCPAPPPVKPKSRRN